MVSSVMEEIWEEDVDEEPVNDERSLVYWELCNLAVLFWVSNAVRCSSVLSYDSGFVIANGQRISNSCPHVPFPNHPVPSKRLPCGSILMKTVRGNSGTGNITLKPFQTYPYQSIGEEEQQIYLQDICVMYMKLMCGRNFFCRWNWLLTVQIQFMLHTQCRQVSTFHTYK